MITARLTRGKGLEGVVRGEGVRPTISDREVPCPQDKVNQAFVTDRPNRLWVADFSYVATSAGFVYSAFVMALFPRRIVGSRVSRPAKRPFVVDAPQQALCDRQPVAGSGLVHHSDRGVQSVAIK